MGKKFGLIIFIRLGSSRLYKKGIIKLNKLTVLEYIIKRTKKIKGEKNIIVATTKNKLDKKIVKICKSNKIKYFCGDNANVAKRAIDCCKKNNLNSFMRICADRIFFDYMLANKMIKIFKSNKYDIVTNTMPKTYPKGLSCEIIKFSTFKENYKLFKKNKGDKEHIMDYFYRNEKDFKIKNFKSNLKPKEKKLSLALDNKNDLKKINMCLKELNYDPYISTKKIIKFYTDNF